MTNTIELPKPIIKPRPFDEAKFEKALATGLHPVLAKVVAARPIPAFETKEEWLNPTLAKLDNPNTMADMQVAVDRLMQALDNKECIALETDHDCDGQTSHAVLHTALLAHFSHPQERIQSFIGHRLTEGYGLSVSVMQRILAAEPRPSLVITADNGSTDEAQIAVLKQHGIDVIVTDHHAIPSEGIPKSAVAVLNPTREDCQYPDPFIAGCMVAWLFMAATRAALIQREGQPKAIPSLANLLDYVAVGTIADCVSIARSRNNRAVVNYGLKHIEHATKPCWQAIRPHITGKVSSTDLGFKIGPLLNSDGRLSSAFGSVSFLLAKDAQEAESWVSYLQTQNTERKAIQKKITDLAMAEASYQVKQGKQTLTILLEDGHAGVHGISASRVKDAFGRPTIIFCPKSEAPDMITGSARSIDDFHLRDTLQVVNDAYPGILDKFGGHKGAAGLTLKRENFKAFSEAFEKAAAETLAQLTLEPVIWSDGEYPVEGYTISFIESIAHHLEPFGREFEAPVFEAQAELLSVAMIGATKIHARLTLKVDDQILKAIWFNVLQHEEAPLPVRPKQKLHIIFEPKINEFRGQKNVDLQILEAWEID